MPSKKGEVLWSRNGDDSEYDDTELIKMWDESMESFMEEMKAKKAGNTTRSEWNVGDFCRAKYRLDGQWYEAEVVKKLPQKRVVVEYIGYNDHEEVDSCMLRASKGNECRELQRQECLLAEYEDEEDSDDEESENQEEYLVVTKEEVEPERPRNDEQITLGSLRQNKDQELESPSVNFIQQQNQMLKPKENKGRKPKPSYTAAEEKEEAEISALRKLSIQNRKMKGVGRSGVEPYSIPEGNHTAAQAPSHPDNIYKQRNEPLPYTSKPSGYSRSEARSEPHPYASGLSDYGRPDIATARSDPYPYASDYGRSDPATARSESFPYANGRSDYGRADPWVDQMPANIREIINFVSQRNAASSDHSRTPWNSIPSSRIPPSRTGPPSSYLPPHPSYGDFRQRRFPEMMPPPPAAGASFPPPHVPDSLSDDTDSLISLLNSWYINGYNTGYYMGLRNARQDSERFSSRHHP